MPNNAPHNALRRAVNRAITEGAPIVTEIPARDYSSYASDGRCHNSQSGTYGHECGKPAAWIGTKASGWQSGFCDHCRRHGDESPGFVTWAPVESE